MKLKRFILTLDEPTLEAVRSIANDQSMDLTLYLRLLIRQHLRTPLKLEILPPKRHSA